MDRLFLAMIAGVPIATFVMLVAPGAIAQNTCAQTLQSRVDAAPAGATLSLDACTYRETVTLHRPITLDGRNQAVIDGDNARIRWVWITSSDVTVKNFRMVNAATPSQVGAIATQGGVSRVTIEGNDLGPTTDGALIAIGGTADSKISNNQLHGGGQMGISTWRNTNLTISGNHVYDNNTSGEDPYWAAGGIKAVQDNGLRITDNTIDHNEGPGIWVDIHASNVVISGNTVRDQTWNPIFFEISSNGEIAGNTITNSKTGEGNWGCIVSSSSYNVNVHDNTCSDTLPLRAQLDNRGDLPPNAGRNNVLRDNLMIRPVPAQATSWWQWSTSGPLVPGQNGNVDSGNVVQPVNTPTPVVTPTAVPIPTVSCHVNVRLNGAESGWRPCGVN
jgi:parallel beta-helix repeat protein